MFSSAEEVLRFIAEENVEFIDVRFCDLPGTMQQFTVPATSFGCRRLIARLQRYASRCVSSPIRRC
jgi:glutamine synthetase